jgi:citrate synthase
MFDMALAATTRELCLGDDAGFVLFAVGRTVGWLAHALEQRETGRLIARAHPRYLAGLGAHAALRLSSSRDAAASESHIA